MAKRRKHHRRASTTLRANSPMKKTSSRRRRHKRSFSLSEANIPIIGKVAFEPTGKGSIGGLIQVGVNKFIPDASLFGIPVRPLLPFILSFVAVKMKQPLIAAGLAGAGTMMLAQKISMLQDGFQDVQYADPNLLRDGVTFYDPGTGTHFKLSPDEASTLQDQFLLSENENAYGFGTYMGDANLLSRDREE